MLSIQSIHSPQPQTIFGRSVKVVSSKIRPPFKWSFNDAASKEISRETRGKYEGYYKKVSCPILRGYLHLHPEERFHGAQSFCRTYELLSYSINAPCQQQPHESSPRSLNLFLQIHFDTVLPSVPRSSKWSPLFRFLHPSPARSSLIP